LRIQVHPYRPLSERWTVFIHVLRVLTRKKYYILRLNNETLKNKWESILSRAKLIAARLGRQAGETVGKAKMTKEEVNVRVRQILKEILSWDWTVRKLAERIGCSTGLISECPAWKAYKERRDQVRKQGTIKTVSLTSEMEAVLGTGDRDETLNQLIAEQEEEGRQDASQAKLYLSHEKKPRRRNS
jgi:superfamily I DNA and RNA helicase